MSLPAIAIEPTRDRAAALRRLAAVEPHAIDGATVVDMAAGADLWDVIEHGRAVGAVAVLIDGERATITAAASSGQYTGAELRMVLGILQARGVRTVGLFTRRPGLVRRLIGAGWELAGAEMVKGIG